MKILKQSLIVALLAAFGFSCETSSDTFDPSKKHSFFLTGIKESVSYEFVSKNGRAESTPEDVRNLTLIIVDHDNNVVFEQYFYNYDYGYPTEGIPDTIFIPELPEGKYTIMASTSEYYYYYYDVANEDGTVWADSVDFDHNRFVIDSWLTSQGPIFVGYEEVELVEDGQHIEFLMSNISSKVKVQLADDQNATSYVYISFESSENHSYSMNTGEFFDNGDYGYFGTYLGPEYYYDYPEDPGNDDVRYLNENSVYVLPRTLEKIYIEVYNDFGYYITTSVDLENGVRINDGDAITFTIDLEAIAGGGGSGSGVFSWEDIEWNDLGEVSIP